MYEYWYDFIKPKCGDKAKLCLMDTNSFIVHVNSEKVYADRTRVIEKRFDTSNYEVDRPLPTGKSKKGNRTVNKRQLDRKIMKEVVALRPSMYRYLTDGGIVEKKKKQRAQRNL